MSVLVVVCFCFLIFFFACVVIIVCYCCLKCFSAVDSARGHVFVTSRDSAAVLIFDLSGNQLGSLPVDHPIGVHVSPTADALFVTDGSSSGVLRSYTYGGLCV